ncbi:MAG: AsmA family protein [Desulfobulbaceae bacterium]
MKQFLRWMTGLLFALAGSMYILLLALPHLLDPNDYKTVITDLVRGKTGRELSIPGDIQVQISPWLDLTCVLGEVKLANSALFPNSNFIESKQAKLELSLWPLLLQRRLHMAGIVLEGATLNFLRNKEGLSNWQPLAMPPELREKATEEPTASGRKQKQPLLQKLLWEVTGLDLGKIHLTQTNVRYDNRQTGRLIVIKDLKLKTGRLREKGQFPFEAAFSLSHDNKIAKKAVIVRSGDIAMQGNATLFLADPHLLLEDLRIKGTIKGQSLPKRGLKVVFSTNSDIQLRQEKVTIKDFSLRHEDIRLQGSGTLEDFSSPSFNISLKVPECSPKSILKQLDITLPDLQNGDALTHLSAGLQVKGNMDMAEITDLTVKLDETTITGAVTVKERINPAYEAIIHINDIDLDRYGRKKVEAPEVLTETGEQQLDAAPGTVEAEVGPPIIPVNLLKALRLQLDLQADSVKVNGAQLSQLQVKLAAKDGLIQLDPLTAHLYDGSMKLKARMDVTGDVPRIQIKQTISKVQLGALLLDTNNRDDMTGTTLIESDLTSSGLSREDLLKHLNGTMRFEVLDGAIKPLPLLQVIRASRDLHREKTTGTATSDEATEFVRLSGTATLEDGILYNDDLVATSEMMHVTGGGEIDLSRGELDLLLKVELAPALVQDEERGLTGLGNTLIPYTITGPFSDLKQEAEVKTSVKGETEKMPLQPSPHPTDQKKKGTSTSPPHKEKRAVGD